VEDPVGVEEGERAGDVPGEPHGLGRITDGPYDREGLAGDRIDREEGAAVEVQREDDGRRTAKNEGRNYCGIEKNGMRRSRRTDDSYAFSFELLEGSAGDPARSRSGGKSTGPGRDRGDGRLRRGSLEERRRAVEFHLMKFAILLASAAAVLSGCASSFRPCHRSPLIEIYARGGEPRAAILAARFEDAIVAMTDEFGAPLDQVIPVRVYVDGDPDAGRSYFNPVTGSIVLRGRLGLPVFAHEMSHLLVRRIAGSPPYWVDQALAEYMEERFVTDALGDEGGAPGRRAVEESHGPRTRRLIRGIAAARNPSDVLAHLTDRAVDEDRSWGMLVVRYLFEGLWTRLPPPEKIRRLLHLDDGEVEEMSPAILAYYRRPRLLAGAR
jgi:hypothetical protein